MSGILLDSSIIIAAERGQLDLGAVTAGRLDLTYLSTITASELLHGVHRADTPRRRLTRSAFVEAVLAAFPILELDLTTARVHAKLWADLEAVGRLIGAHDLWIAATALAHSLTIMSTNRREFARVSELALESVTLKA
ncbi:MAG: PIN domain-containing protein [Gemmatimonadales bacterium]